MYPLKWRPLLDIVVEKSEVRADGIPCGRAERRRVADNDSSDRRAGSVAEEYLTPFYGNDTSPQSRSSSTLVARLIYAMGLV